MNHFLTVLFLFLCTTSLSAQDVIVKKDGSTILSKVLEVNEANIKYKKYSNPQGPTYTINITDIVAINYENGDSDKFSSIPNSKNDDNTTDDDQQFIMKEPDANNTYKIKEYNKLYELKKKSNGNNNAKICFAFMNVKENSTLSNEDLEISFKSNKYSARTCECDFTIMLSNKTSHTIYVDLGNTFSVDQNGATRVYYDVNSTTISKGKSNGIGVNLGSIANVFGIGGIVGSLAGGVSVSSGKGTNVSTTYATQRILAIPPRAVIPLSSCNNQENTIISRAESVCPANSTHINGSEIINKGDVLIGKETVFNEMNTPYSRDYIITYSTKESFTTYSALKFGVYISELIGFKMPMDNETSKYIHFKRKIGKELPDNVMVGMYGVQ